MLKNLLDISTSIQKREIQFPNGEKETLYIKELTAVDTAKYIDALNSSDADVRAKANVEFIAKSLCDESGKQLLTVEDAAKIKAKNLHSFAPIIEAIGEVNGMFGEKKE